MASKLEPTSTPGVFRRHVGGCARTGRCECSYVVVWRHRGRQHKATYRTLSEAREAKAARQSGDRRPVARVTFGDYFAEWIESYAGRTARGFSETTRPEYRRPIEQHAVKRWGGWKLAEVEPADVRELYGDLRKAGATTAGIRKLRAALSALFATAVEDGLIRSSPVVGVRVPPGPQDATAEDEGQSKALTRAELRLLLAALDGEARLFFELLAHTGLRVSEAVGLTWEHLDLGGRPRVKVREQVYRGHRKRLKSAHARRDVPLSPGMVDKLIAHRRDSFKGKSRPVFVSARGTELHPSNVRNRQLVPATKAVGLGWEDDDGKWKTWVGFHTFRHTTASLLFDHGKNVKQVQEWLGHADPGFTLRTYVHLLDDGLGGAGFLDEAVSEGAQGNAGATRGTETAANREASEAPDSAL